MNSTSRWRKSSSISTRCRTLLPARSNAATTTTSVFRPLTSAISLSSPGRRSLVPETPWSTNSRTSLQPRTRQSRGGHEADCRRSGRWCSHDSTRQRASLVVVLLWSAHSSGRRMGVVRSREPLAPLKWYYRPGWVVVLLFLVLGPLALPYLWRSPGFSRRLKFVLTVLVIAYTGLFIDEMIRVVRAVKNEMDALETVPDF